MPKELVTGQCDGLHELRRTVSMTVGTCFGCQWELISAIDEKNFLTISDFFGSFLVLLASDSN